MQERTFSNQGLSKKWPAVCPGHFGLTEVSTRPTKSCRIGNFAGATAQASTRWHGKGPHPVSAYYLLRLPNNDNMQALPNHVPYMFTMHLSACQFLAYGYHHNPISCRTFPQGISRKVARIIALN